MYDFDTIAVPIDFSRSSRAALSLARSLADGGVVRPLHVVQPWPAYMQQVLFPYAPLGEDAAEIEHELVATADAALANYHELGEDEELEVVFGPLKTTIIEQIARTPADLVIAGAFGEGGPMPDTLGSTAERIAMSAGRSVLLVRGIDTKPQVNKILVALDLTEGSERVFEVAARLAIRAGAELETIHVVPDPLRDDQSKVMKSVLKYDRRKTAQQARDRVEALFERLFRSVEPKFSDAADVSKLGKARRVAIGDPALTTIRYAVEVGADAIVVGSQSPRRQTIHHGRVASTILRRAPVHTCIVPMAPASQDDDDD